jgi:hypothetical protein
LEDISGVVESPLFFGVDALEVVGVDVVPELAQEGVVGVVVSVGLGVGDLEIGAELGGEGRKEVADGEHEVELTRASRP